MRLFGVVLAAVSTTLFAASVYAQSPVRVAAADPMEPMAAVSPQASDTALPPAVTAEPDEPEQAVQIPPPEPTLFAVIDLTHQTMRVSDKNGEIARWKISSARGGYKTPTGTYTPHYTARMHYSKQYHMSPMPYSVFFNEGIAVHGTGDLRNLGRPASHGCVRSHPRNAKIFYDLVQKHGMQLTRVTVVGKAPYSAPVAERRQQRRTVQPSYQQPFGGLFGYSQPKPKKKRYGGGSYNTW